MTQITNFSHLLPIAGSHLLLTSKAQLLGSAYQEREDNERGERSEIPSPSPHRVRCNESGHHVTRGQGTKEIRGELQSRESTREINMAFSCETDNLLKGTIKYKLYLTLPRTCAFYPLHFRPRLPALNRLLHKSSTNN